VFFSYKTKRPLRRSLGNTIVLTGFLSSTFFVVREALSVQLQKRTLYNNGLSGLLTGTLLASLLRLPTPFARVSTALSVAAITTFTEYILVRLEIAKLKREIELVRESDREQNTASPSTNQKEKKEKVSIWSLVFDLRARREKSNKDSQELYRLSKEYDALRRDLNDISKD